MVSMVQVRSGTKSLKFYNDLNACWDQTKCTAAASKARVETSLGANQYKLTKSNTAGAAGGMPTGKGFTYGVGAGGWLFRLFSHER